MARLASYQSTNADAQICQSMRLARLFLLRESWRKENCRRRLPSATGSSILVKKAINFPVPHACAQRSISETETTEDGNIRAVLCTLLSEESDAEPLNFWSCRQKDADQKFVEYLVEQQDDRLNVLYAHYSAKFDSFLVLAGFLKAELLPKLVRLYPPCLRCF